MADVPLLGNEGSFSPEQRERVDGIITDFNATTARMDAILAGMKSKEFVQYTLFASGLRRGRSSELEGKNQTDDIAILFDAVVQHNYSKEYNKTSYAVESKSKSSDHVVTQDGKFTFSAKITDSPYLIDERNYIDKDTDKDSPMDAKRPSKALEILEEIADSHQLVTLVTEDNILTNYVITSLSATREASTGSSIDISVTLEEFRFKSASKTVLATRTADPKKAGNKNSGTKQTSDSGQTAEDAQGKRKSPYLSKKRPIAESWENSLAGTEDFGGAAGTKIVPGEKFDPSSLTRPK